MKFPKYITLFFALLAAVIYFNCSPQGGWLFFYLLFAGISLSSIYVSLVPGTMSFGRMISASTAFIFYLGMVAIGYRAGMEGKGVELLAEHIKPYPNITEVDALPIRPGSATLQAWEMTTPDSLLKVREFYSDEANYQGWELSSDIGRFYFKKSGYALEIVIHKKKDGAVIMYHLAKGKV